MNIENDTCYLNLKSEMSLVLTQDIIDHIKSDVTGLICTRMEDVRGIILYGSCARGDYSPDSDIDIAVLIDENRSLSDTITETLSSIATELAMKYFAVVNCIFIPYNEYLEKKAWYPFYRNIAKEGDILYGTEVLRWKKQ